MSFPQPFNSLINTQAQLLDTLATYQLNGTNSLASILSATLKSTSDSGCFLALRSIRGTSILNQFIAKAIQATNSAEDDIADWMITYSDQVPSDIIELEKKLAAGMQLVTTVNIKNLPIDQRQTILNNYTQIQMEGNALALKYNDSIFSRLMSACQLILADFNLEENEIFN